jgi:hypothetical protein
MNLLLIAGALLVALLIVIQLVRLLGRRRLLQGVRWIVGGTAALLAVFLLLRGRVDIASIVGALAFTILRYGRLGPLVIGGGQASEDNKSAVRSRYISMTLDHASGDVSGRVTAGSYRGMDLMDLGEEETRLLLAEIEGDPDSQALLETWLDRNRAGWREYFAEQYGDERFGTTAGQGATGGTGEGGARTDPEAEAYKVLGLQPGATADEIREAHRKLMKKVHPDQGGSTYLASKINEAKDRLLKQVGS